MRKGPGKYCVLYPSVSRCPSGSHRPTAGVLTDARYRRDILEMRLFGILSIAVLLESLKKFEQDFLGDFTPSSFKISKLCESEIGIQLMCYRIERTAQSHFCLGGPPGGLGRLERQLDGLECTRLTREYEKSQLKELTTSKCCKLKLLLPP